MYPVIRLMKELWVHRKDPPLPFGATHVSHHICWPWDLDPWMELNNGRTLTLFDLGRMPMNHRAGLISVFRARGWGMTVAGSTVRYRRRVRVFQRVTMKGRFVGWDQRFFYMEQSMWRQGEALNHILLRLAVTSAQGIVPPATVVEAIGAPETGDLPAWVQAWSNAEAQRPWPPQLDS
jgi:acyl-CoA thioesterase FadM